MMGYGTSAPYTSPSSLVAQRPMREGQILSLSDLKAGDVVVRHRVGGPSERWLMRVDGAAVKDVAATWLPATDVHRGVTCHYIKSAADMGLLPYLSGGWNPGNWLSRATEAEAAEFARELAEAKREFSTQYRTAIDAQ